jgi:hypothetical protein
MRDADFDVPAASNPGFAVAFGAPSCSSGVELDHRIELIVASVTRPKVPNFIATEAL